MGTTTNDGPSTTTDVRRASDRRPVRRLVLTGLLATLVAMVATTLVAALAQALGVDFMVSGSDEAIPLAGFATVTGLFSVLGVVLAAVLLRWSAHPATRLVQTAVTLTAVSLVPPLLLGDGAATSVALVVLHLVAAAVMIPALARSLRTA
ncbi:DUF6069 family protein [Cellulomonas xylanilytica]|uniref:Uncharacterized protein n=1 Tax=Cellulomonas xylanilytica TaxID=233583 RepID=A0A510V7A0_9CELL|nr:DUF6069 family protein [Cellulomonas xylanilytica]GEK22666.1 hypothetical protein CXY01_31860 [Cellulomonas xylanilytica]